MSGYEELRGLSESFDDDVRDEASQVEALAEIARVRGRTMAGAMADLAARGDRVRVTSGPVSMVGVLSVASEDLAILDADEAEATINLAGPITVGLVEESTSGGVTERSGSRTFKARLREFELSGEPVTLAGSFGERSGVIGAVSADHVVLDRGEGEMYLPLAVIGLVARPTPRTAPVG